MCPWCGVVFADHPRIKTRVWDGKEECASKQACMHRRKVKQRGNRDRFGKVLGTNPCELILTGASKKAGEPGLRVRCYCMAPLGSNKHHSFKYDTLGDVHSIAEARALWDAHVAEKRRKSQVFDLDLPEE